MGVISKVIENGCNMFNVFQYDREVELHDKEQKMSRSQSMLQHRKKQNDPILVKNYNYRVEKFLKTSMVRPVIQHDHNPPLQVVPRPSDPKKFKGSASFIIKGFKTEKQRIKESLENNKILDINPIHSSYNKHVPKVKKFLIRKPAPGKSNEKFPVLKVDSSESDDESGKSSMSGSESQFIYVKGIPKKTMKKTHFKALIQKLVQENPLKKFELGKRDTVFGNFPVGTLQPLVALIQNSNKRLRFLSRPLSLQVLENCNVVVPKKLNMFLRKGQGHLMGSTGEVKSNYNGKFLRLFD